MRIGALVSRLLSHFWTANDTAEARQLQIQDWLDDLREFGPAVVEGACQRWRRTESRRPTPADIRKACFDEQRDYPRHYGIEPERTLPSPQHHDSDEWQKPSPEDIAYVDELINRMKNNQNA
jgi:hypothetical protein